MSWPVSRILSGTIIHLGASLPTPSCDLPGMHRASNAPFLFGLAPNGVYHATAVTGACGALLPHLFTLARTDGALGLFSAALSIASRRPGVIRRYALWSPDFPLHLADKATVQPTRFLLYGSIGAAIHNIGDLCKFMSGLRKRLPGRILGLLIGKDA